MTTLRLPPIDGGRNPCYYRDRTPVSTLISYLQRYKYVLLLTDNNFILDFEFIPGSEQTGTPLHMEWYATLV